MSEMEEAQKTFDRWFDMSDIPEEAIDEISTLSAAYMTMDLMAKLTLDQKLSLFTEIMTCVFNIGRAHGYPKVGKYVEK